MYIMNNKQDRLVSCSNRRVSAWRCCSCVNALNCSYSKTRTCWCEYVIQWIYYHVCVCVCVCVCVSLSLSLSLPSPPPPPSPHLSLPVQSRCVVVEGLATLAFAHSLDEDSLPIRALSRLLHGRSLRQSGHGSRSHAAVALRGWHGQQPQTLSSAAPSSMIEKGGRGAFTHEERYGIYIIM